MTDPVKAEALRKQGNFEQALPIFQQIWEQTGEPRPGAAYANCLRRTGNPARALEIAREVLKKDADNFWARTELVWSLNDAHIKPAHDANDISRLLAAAEEIFQLTDQDLPRTRAMFAVIDTARARGNWALVLEWCNRMPPDNLSPEPHRIEGKRLIIPDRERWYLAKIRALLGLERWTEARQMAMEAAVIYPKRIDFPRWAAKALAGSGDLPGAIREVEALTRGKRVEWYILAELAELLMRVGKMDDARQQACIAALAPGENKAKVNLFHLMARIFLAQNEKEKALNHLMLSKNLRIRQGWPVPGSIIQLEKELIGDSRMPHELQSQSIEDLLRECSKVWESPPHAGLQRKRGKILSISLNKKFGFIGPEDGGEPIFFLTQDIPRGADRVGILVEFTPCPNFDKKKGRESLRAINIVVTKS